MRKKLAFFAARSLWFSRGRLPLSKKRNSCLICVETAACPRVRAYAHEHEGSRMKGKMS